MRKIVPFVFLALVLINFVSAIRINEIMYDPKPTTDAYNEWIEIYNEGDSEINLEGWALNGKVILEEVVIQSGGYLIFARKLLQGTASNPDSFESVWGNGDGVWDGNDGNYLVIQLSFGNGLSNGGGTISLKDDLGEIVSSISYSSSMGANGNGKSLQYCSGNWIENNPSPGNLNICSSSSGSPLPSNEEENETIISSGDNEEPPEIQEETITFVPEETPVKKEINNSPIRLTPKDIKTSDSKVSSGKVEYSKYSIIVFCILLALLFILKPRKKKNEFKE